MKSMTGFGRAEAVKPAYKISAEIRSVNHRYLDISIKIPRRFYPFESALRQLLKETAKRGKMDVYIGYEGYAGSALGLSYNPFLASEYFSYAQRMERELGAKNDCTVTALMRMPEVFSMSDPDLDEEELKDAIFSVVSEAAVHFNRARLGEGRALKEDLLLKCSCIEDNLSRIEDVMPECSRQYAEKLRTKVENLLSQNSMDEQRLMTEVAIFADRVSIDEEVVRLYSHLNGLRQCLSLEEPVGRKLDFIVQEMNREANTIVSKTGDIRISQWGINIKTDIEKIREQVQNIE